jgi:hypothetical protein
MNSTSKPSKAWLRDTFVALWESGGVLVGVDGGHPDLIIPAELRQTIFTLDYDPNAVVPITGFQISEDGIMATLSFARRDQKTFVPWEAVIGLMPRLNDCPPSGSPPTPAKRNHLKLVP